MDQLFWFSLNTHKYWTYIDQVDGNMTPTVVFTALGCWTVCATKQAI